MRFKHEKVKSQPEGPPMELEQLRQFVQTAAYLNFTRAAAAVGLSQPALSRSIARLEEELGQPLFTRQTRQLVLTDAGTLLLSRARQMLALAEDARAEISDDGQTGRVRIGAIPTVAPFFLPSTLKRFQRTCPHARLVVQEDTTDHLLHALSEGEIDVAIAALPLEARYLAVEELFEEELFTVMAARHPLTRKRSLHLSDLEPYPFVLLGEAHCLTDNILAFCQQKSFHPLQVEKTSQLAMVQELVALNHGVSLIPAMARRHDTNRRRVYRQLAGNRPQRTIAMVTNPYRYHSRLLLQFLDLVRESRQP